MSKTPFEIRLDVLKMAQEMLNREKSLEEAAYLANIETLKTTNISAVANYITNHRPVVYSSEDVITRSKALYTFVTDKAPNNKEK
jgi:hypothetical protein